MTEESLGLMSMTVKDESDKTERSFAVLRMTG